MIVKYANHEAILEIKTASERLPLEEAEGAMLAKFAKTTSEPEVEDGYVYVRTRAISSRVNKNNDGWPSEELAKAYRSFVGRPVFVDHNNSDPRRTRGVVVDAKLHVEDEKTSALDPYYSNAPDNHRPPTWVELLIEVDGKTYPKLAQHIKTGDIDATSMGANIEKSICSVCGNEATVPDEYCNHIKSKGATFEITADNGEKVKKKAYEDCYGVNFFEDSFVFDPADETALNIGVDDKMMALASISKEAFDPTVLTLGLSGLSGLIAALSAWQTRRHLNVNQNLANPNEQEARKELYRIFNEYGFSDAAHDQVINRLVKGESAEKVLGEMQSHFAKTAAGIYDFSQIVIGLEQLGLESGRIRDAIAQLKEGADPDEVLGAVPGAADVIKNSVKEASVKTADADDEKTRQLNYEPQSDKQTAPAKVDTLQDDVKCPNCGVDVLEADPDGILRCPTCQYEQPPEGLDNPDLSMAQEIDKDKTIEGDTDDSEVIRATDEDADDEHFIKPFTNENKESATNSNVPTGVISEMKWETKIATDSATEANEALEGLDKVAASVTIPYPGGQGIHNGTSAAFMQAGITAVVTVPGAPLPITLPFQNPNLHVMLTMLKAQGVLQPGAPVTVDSDNPELAVELINRLSGEHTGSAKDVKTPNKSTVVVPQSGKKGDAPTNEKVVEDQLEPVTADRRVIKREESPDGHRTEQIVEETGDLLGADEDTPKAEKKDEDKDSNEPRSQKERESEESDEEDTESKPENNGTPPWLKKKEPVAASVDPHEKLLAALAVAEQAVEMKIIESTKKMAFVGQLEDESLEEIEARRKTLALVKSAGLTNRRIASSRPVSALPKLAYSVSDQQKNGSGSLDDVPFEAVFLS